MNQAKKEKELRQDAEERLYQQLASHYGSLPKMPGDDAIQKALIAQLVQATPTERLEAITLQDLLDKIKKVYSL